jgi:NADH-quinone oxidoreductase subunit N
MFSLSGLPPTAGFIAKFYIFKTAVDTGHMTIAFIGILTSIVSVYYYLRVVYFLYMKDADSTSHAIDPDIFGTGALLISLIGIFAIGLFPTPLFNAAGAAARALLP